MGLDLVELVMEVEQSFGITIRDEEAAGLITVGDLYHYILDRLGGEELGVCLSSAAFYRFRRAVMEQQGTDRKGIRPTTRMTDLFPSANRRSAWSALEARLGWHFVRLERPAGMGFVLLSLCCLMATILTPVSAAIGMNAVAYTFLCFVGTVLLIVCGLWLTRPWAVCFPEGCETVRGFLEASVIRNYGALAKQAGCCPRGAVWETLRAIICNVLGVRPEEVVESASFVDDFGAD